MELVRKASSGAVAQERDDRHDRHDTLSAAFTATLRHQYAILFGRKVLESGSGSPEGGPAGPTLPEHVTGDWETARARTRRIGTARDGGGN